MDQLRALTPADRALLTEAEKIRIQYRNMPTAMLGMVVICTLMSMVLEAGTGPGRIAIWMACVYVWAGARFLLWRAFSRLQPPAQEIHRWRTYSVVGSAFAGLIWGVGALELYVPGGFSDQMFLVMGLVGMGSGCVYASASVMPSFFAYFYPSILLPATLFLREPDAMHVATGLLMLLYVSLMTPFALHLSRFITESISLRFENLGLIEELRNQKDAAEGANVAKSRFLAAASHDLRQPLHALGLFVQSLQESPLASRERHVIGNIRRSVDAMEDLFNSLLDISRLDAGVVQPHVATIPLFTVFDSLRFEYAPVARQKNLALIVMKTSVYVRSDVSLLSRIIRNLLSNALSYTDRGGVVLGCRRSVGSLRRGVLVAVPAAAAARPPPAAPSRAAAVVIVAGTLAVAGRTRGSRVALGFRPGRRRGLSPHGALSSHGGLWPHGGLRRRRGRLEQHLRRLEHRRGHRRGQLSGTPPTWRVVI